jgi:catechol 2,3-dioxygenase-like lactoylglutathione lyase family enzyme
VKIIGLDRIEILVRDMDKALDLFSNKLGMKFIELTKEISERDGIRSLVCHETHIHLISPILPLPENAPPPLKAKTEMLKTQEAFIMAITFKVEEPQKASVELQKQGIKIQKHQYKKSHDYASIGLDNFEEVITYPESTLGILIGFADYEN